MNSDELGAGMRETTGIITDLIDWYWAHARLRDPKYALGIRWIADLYRRHNTSCGLESRRAKAKKTVAIWGPSQAGKSTMFAEFLDDRESADSALTWPGGASYRFRMNPHLADIPAFNPFNDNNDASGCVTQFEMVKDVPDPEHPVRITLMDREQILQTLAAGYLWECRLESETHPKVSLDDQSVLARADNYLHATDATADRDAVELLVDAAAAVRRLIKDGQPRWERLRYKSVWQREVEHQLFAKPGLTCNQENCRRFIYDLLWDDQGPLNKLYEELAAYAASISEQFGGKPLHGSLSLASLLVDIDAYRRMEAHPRDDADSAKALHFIESLRIIDKGGHYAISDDASSGQLLFPRGLMDFGLFQALVWELNLPLRAEFLERRSAEVSQFLGEATLLDVPGVSQKEKGSDETKIDLAGAGATKETLLSHVVKRGKTVTIINRYAQEMRVDLVLLLARIMQPIPKTEQLISGVRAIWNEIDPNYDPLTGQRPPVPVVLGLTFLSKLINGGYDDGFRSNFEPLEEMVGQLGPLADPKNVSIFTTTYPFFHEGTIRSDCDPEFAYKKLQEKTWFRRRFAHNEAQQSLRSAISDEDGGVGMLVAGLSKRLKETDLNPLLATRTSGLVQDIGSLLEQALPKQSDGDKHQAALRAFVARIKEQMQIEVSADKDPAIDASRHLRRLFQFDDEGFEPLPLAMDPNHGSSHEKMVDYVARQLTQWSTRPEVTEPLIALGLPTEDHFDVMMALQMSIDIEDIAHWSLSALGGINTQDAARNARRFLAARCAKGLLRQGPDAGAPSGIDTEALQTKVAKRFALWAMPGRTAVDSPHYERIIEPLLDTLTEIAENRIEVSWEPQSGDKEIQEIHSGWGHASPDTRDSLAEEADA